MIHMVYDANNLAFRCNSVTELYTKDGKRTSAIVGVLNAINSDIVKLNKMYNDEICEVITCWDFGHAEFRKSVFPEYKANRKKERTEEEQQFYDEFIEQTNVLHDNLGAFGIKSLKIKGWEGDDLVAITSKTVEAFHPEDKVVLISTDEDYHQMISDEVDLYSPIKGILYTKDNYKELMGIDLENFLAYKIIKGDTSDGIPGIPLMGEKTTKDLVNKYGGLEGILSHKNDLIKSKRTARIFTQEGLMTLDRNNKLINIYDYIDFDPIIESITETVEDEPFVDTKYCKDFLMKYQLTSILVKFKTWIKTFEDVADNFWGEE